MSLKVGHSKPHFAPPGHAAVLYPGKVMHARLKPVGHRFNYRVFSALFDISRLVEADKTSWLFSVNKRNLVSFYESDHLPKDDTTHGRLNDYITYLVLKAGLGRPARVLLLAYPRIFGFVFNPISVYFCYDEDDTLTALIYEVRNTFGGKHTYVCAVEDGQLTQAGVRQERTKIFYVSPFIDMGARYHFRVSPPTDTVRLRIFETEANEPLLSATFSGTAEAFDSRQLSKQLVLLPFMTLKVVAGIHWEAVKLWIKGAKYHGRAPEPQPVSYRDQAPQAGE